MQNSFLLPASEYLKPFWQHWKIYPKQTNCHLYGIYHYKNKVEAERLRNSIQLLIDYSYNLRSNFTEENGELQWIIKPSSTAKLSIYSTRSASEREILVNNLAAKPFDIQKNDLFRFYLIDHVESHGCTLVVVFHHIILDGMQFDFFMHELGKYYQFGSNARYHLSTIDDLKTYFELEKSRIAEAEINFWIEQIKDYPTGINLPFMNKDVPLEKQKTCMRFFKLPLEVTRELIFFSTKYEISIFNILKIIWATLIGRYSSQEKLIIVHAVSVRGKTLSRLLGSFINILPFAINLNMSLEQQIAIERHLIPYYRKNRYIPTQNIIQKLNDIFPNLKFEDIFQIVIAQTNLRMHSPLFHAEIVGHPISTPNIGSAVLLFEYQCVNNELYFQINFLSPAINDEFVERMGEHLKSILFNAMQNPQQQLAKLPCISEENYNVIKLFEVKDSTQFFQLKGARW